MMWSYSIRGTFPAYKIPTQKTTKLDNKLSYKQKKAIDVRRSAKINYLVKNINKAIPLVSQSTSSFKKTKKSHSFFKGRHNFLESDN